jgi:opacity protein-like surface antigen
MGGSAVLGIVCGAIVALTPDDEDSNDDPYSRRGWIFGVGGVYGIEDFDDPAKGSGQDVLEPPPVKYSTDNSFALAGGLGYRCHKYISTEVGFELFGIDEFDGEYKQSGFGKMADVVVNPLVITVDTRGYYPIGRYQPYAVLGTGVMMAEIKPQHGVNVHTGEPAPLSNTNDASFTMRFGGGIDVYATENIVVRGEASYVLPTGHLHDLKYVSIGLGVHWRF